MENEHKSMVEGWAWDELEKKFWRRYKGEDEWMLPGVLVTRVDHEMEQLRQKLVISERSNTEQPWTCDGCIGGGECLQPTACHVARERKIGQAEQMEDR